jgi:ribosomal protein S18 acetylase RimI-like enzyme
MGHGIADNVIPQAAIPSSRLTALQSAVPVGYRPCVDVTSLGFQTDLMIRRLAGSVIVDHQEYLVVQTPANPGFWWGNFLLFLAPPRPGQVADWVAAFTADFPGAGHLAFGVDGTHGDHGDPAELAGFGLAAEVSTVLTALRLREPAWPAADTVFRPLASDDDWAQAAELGLACDDHRDDPHHRLFAERRVREARELCCRGSGAWFGAFVGGRMRSGCGIFGAAGVLRFQSVETDPGYRRRGLARRLVYEAGSYGLTAFGGGTLVIVADPGDVAILIYRSLGFADAERQVQLMREPPPGEGQPT